jgi:hypothetical protein
MRDNSLPKETKRDRQDTRMQHMSNNPFEDLAKNLELINQRSGTHFRRLVDLSEEIDQFSFLSNTMQLLQSAKKLSQAVGQDDAIRDMFDEIQWTMLQPDADWNLTNTVSFSPRDISMIRLIGHKVSSQGLLLRPLTTEMHDALQMALKKIQEQLSILATTLPPESLGYLRYLINRSLDLLNGEEIDLVTLRSVCTQAGTAAYAFHTHITDEEEQSAFHNACKTIIDTWIAPLATNIAGNLTSGGIGDLIGS